VVLDCSGGWVQHLGVFARLYSLVCICLPVEVRALLASLPAATVWVPPGDRREPLHFQSIRGTSNPPQHKPHTQGIHSI